MRVINISLDNKILDKNSSVAKRAIAYGDKLDEYFVLVPADNKSIKLSSKTKVVGIKASNKFFTLFKIYKYLDKHLKDNKYDIISIQDNYYLASMGINLARRYGLKTEIQVHGFEKLSAFRKILVEENFKTVDSIRVVSDRLKKYLIINFSIDNNKISVVPIAIDKDKILVSKGKLNLKEKYSNSFIFLTVARLVAIKNIAMQIRALAKIKNKEAKLVVVGDGPEKDNLQKLVKDLDLLDRVIFEGWIDNLADYYHSVDCLLLSSDSEGYGAVVAEAVLAELPVIMTDVGVAGELVEDNVNGLIVPVKNQELFTKAMNKLTEDKNLLQKFFINTQIFKNKILDKEELINRVVDNWRAIL